MAAEVESVVVTSDPTYSVTKNIGSYHIQSWQFDYTNGSGVTASIQYSNTGTAWVTDTTTSIALGSSGSVLFNPQVNGAAYSRMKFAGATGCIGTLTLNHKSRGH